MTRTYQTKICDDKQTMHGNKLGTKFINSVAIFFGVCVCFVALNETNLNIRVWILRT